MDHAAHPLTPAPSNPAPASDRYARQRRFQPIGDSGQDLLARAHVAILGLGALGATAADLLARAGVGTLTLIDRDVVEPSNLQRQTLYDEHDSQIGLPKAEAAAARLHRVNSTVTLRPIVADATPDSIESLLDIPAHPNIILLDATDSIESRHLLNDVAVKHHRPLIFGAIVASRGMQATFTPPRGPCLRCIFPDAPAPGAMPTCDTVGVLAPVAAIVAAAQANDALKLALNREDLLPRSLLDFDSWANTRRRLDLTVAQDPACPCCALRRFDALTARTAPNAQLCGQNAVQISPPPNAPPADLHALALRWRSLGTVVTTRFMLRLTLPDAEISLFADGRAIIKGTQRPDLARALYARFVGV